VTLTLKPFQVEGIDYLRDHPNCLLADEAGLGKSAQMLKAAIEPVLVVAPAMILESGTWDDEIAKWAPGMDVTQVAYSSIAVRGERGRVERDSLNNPISPPKPQYGIPRWGTVILDESHYIKGRKTSWANAVLQLKAQQTFLATGTPMPNWAVEAFMILRAIWPEESRAGGEYGSFWRWANKWFHVGSSRWKAREVGDLRTAGHIAQCWECREEGKQPVTWELFREVNWGDRMLRRLRKDVLPDLPPLQVQPHATPMGAEQKRAYKDLKKDFITWLDSGAEIAVWSEPGLLVKLAQLTTGLENLEGAPRKTPTGKYRHLIDKLEERSDDQVFVVAHFRKTIDVSAAYARRMGRTVGVVRGGMPVAERAAAVRAFQQGEIDTLVASVNTIAEGVTLHQAGCHHAIRVERSATPSKNDQVLRRLHRIGQEEKVFAVDLETPQSYDSKLTRMLQEKNDEQMEALGDAEMRELIS
jgi:SNF2 family DNA or RNA helicase